ncbi:Heterokaryon incompatibility protein 6, OR allele [Tolypocladium ophioglossoides CBS 100239]|uniref:Heterokaryon incompatibility protein 6, OR allele n=1 Tax=Tolypocladium ophioglossoides (strain CBS 100239) TaxID=1163406 RepID=A0A0L0N5M1_TOLOC|nr:Heterokaryon incompatibility protein 6, OR allele [Tolypocladium ophioglossoides CBS 100239]
MASESEPILMAPYASRPLDANTESIRLVTIEPELNQDGLLICGLSTATFAARPAYEALSYRWGDDSINKKIVVDDVEFNVTENLWGALHHMRNKPRRVPIWIDAISINQHDIPEKNRQLRIMPHIYTRASTVLVWLGAAYSAIDVNADDHSGSEQLMNMMVTDGYWNRVWILQEIGKARKIQVCIGGGEALDWNRFIRWVDCCSERSMNRGGPFNLDHLQRNKYNGSRSLKRLLETHADARCKDPRDKICGLVGLSSDGHGFPMDYSKSLLDVWVDTVNFMSRRGLLPESCAERVAFCKLVRDLLGADELGTVGGVVQFHNREPDYSLFDDYDSNENDEMARSAMSLPADVLGVVNSLGPSATELISSLDLTDKWEAELQRLHPGELDTAFQEHDALMQCMLGSPNPQPADLASFDNHRIDFIGTELFSYLSYYPDDEDQPMSPGLRESWNHTTATPEEPRLAILRFRALNGTTPFKIALVPPRAQLGDMVCRIKGFPMKRVVVRHERCATSRVNTRMHVFGTAVLARDVMAETTWDEEEVQGAYGMNALMDARTFYALVFGDEGTA